jgi:phosphatidylinositol alpha-mannosyltransferase
VYVDRFASVEPRPEWRGDDGTVVFVGRLGEPRKGFALLARAFGELATARPGVRLLVVGGGDIDEARDLLPQAARAQVTFLGRASDADRAGALRTADVCVAPNTGGESFGIVLVEAMAAGATVLASDLPAFRRVLDDGAAGALFASGDADDLLARLTGLLDDRDRRASLDRAARVAVRRYDWSAVADRILRVYETVVAAGVR